MNFNTLNPQSAKTEPLYNGLGVFLSRFLPNKCRDLVCRLVRSAGAAVEDGSLCLDLTPAQRQELCILGTPDITEQSASAHFSSPIGDGSIFTPLVLEGQRLYFFKHWKTEEALAKKLGSRLRDLQEKTPTHPRPSPVSDTRLTEAQRIAVEAVQNQSLCLLAGGPGTGKTWTLAHALSQLLEAGVDPRLVGVTAPTGKAATRLKQALRQHFGPALSDGHHVLLGQVGTLQRALGMRENGSFRFGPEQPAPFSHLIVDEATMVDAYLMEAAVAALPADAALILVGDPGQLPSVGPGQVFTDLVAVAQQVGNPSLISLERPFRFEATGTISAFAEAVLTGDVSETFKLLRRGDPALGWLPPPETEAEWNDWATPLVSHARELQASFERHLASGSEPANPWELLGKQVVLTPLRRGPAGAQFLNQLILNQLADTGPAGTLPVGTPMLTTRNHPALELWNGDAGLLDEDGLIHFGAGKRVSRASLGDAVTAHAITVHRSQGSEYECAALVLPSTPHPLVTRELLFTAVSRARKQLTVYASEASLVAALEHSEVRSSGLRGKLIANATDQS